MFNLQPMYSHSCRVCLPRFSAFARRERSPGEDNIPVVPIAFKHLQPLGVGEAEDTSFIRTEFPRAWNKQSLLRLSFDTNGLYVKFYALLTMSAFKPNDDQEKRQLRRVRPEQKAGVLRVGGTCYHYARHADLILPHMRPQRSLYRHSSILDLLFRRPPPKPLR